jgi:hypothetical protein
VSSACEPPKLVCVVGWQSAQESLAFAARNAGACGDAWHSWQVRSGTRGVALARAAAPSFSIDRGPSFGWHSTHDGPACAPASGKAFVWTKFATCAKGCSSPWQDAQSGSFPWWTSSWQRVQVESRPRKRFEPFGSTTTSAFS